MAPLLFKEMKGVNFSCASPASAAICTSIDRKSMVRPSTGRVIDRHTPHLRDPRRAKTTVNSMNQAPTRSKSYREKSRRSLGLEDTAADELLISTPPGSARYLLNDDAFIDVFPGLKDAQPPRSLLSIELDGPKATKKEDCTPVFKPCPSTGKKDQVVVLRVSLHCKGCEGKVRKHISRMEGVTSFDIDFASKKVTVVGDVSPLGVLNSLSKVKNAQLWPSPWSPPQP